MYAGKHAFFAGEHYSRTICSAKSRTRINSRLDSCVALAKNLNFEPRIDVSARIPRGRREREEGRYPRAPHAISTSLIELSCLLYLDGDMMAERMTTSGLRTVIRKVTMCLRVWDWSLRLSLYSRLSTNSSASNPFPSPRRGAAPRSRSSFCFSLPSPRSLTLHPLHRLVLATFPRNGFPGNSTRCYTTCPPVPPPPSYLVAVVILN